jgi:hypothetical protein
MIEYLCKGCGRCITNFTVVYPPSICPICQALGADRSRLLYDRQHGLITEETFDRLWAEAPT